MNKILLLLISLFVASCGGGGDSGGIAKIKTTATTLVTLSNGQGVGRIIGENKIGFIYSPEISTVIRDINNQSNNESSSSIADIDPNNFPVISTTPISELRRGVLESDGTSLNVSLLNSKSTEDAFGAYIQMPNDADAIMMIGDSPTNIPLGGVVQYRGVFTQNARSVIAPGQIGSFIIEVNYDSKTFKINAGTSSLTLSGSGLINTSTGLFASAAVAVAVNGLNYSSSLYGNLNGERANTISGVFYTNDNIPDYSGSFIGSR
jgi:hypothetical protein